MVTLYICRMGVIQSFRVQPVFVHAQTHTHTDAHTQTEQYNYSPVKALPVAELVLGLGVHVCVTARAPVEDTVVL